jgi:hypothetical protein
MLPVSSKLGTNFFGQRYMLWPEWPVTIKRVNKMNTKPPFRNIVFALCAVIILLTSACQPAGQAANTPIPFPVTLPTSTPAPVSPTAAPATQTPVKPTQTPEAAASGITLDLVGVAQKMIFESPAMPTWSWWVDAPFYRRVTLQGYPVTNHVHKPQIFIYAVADLPVASDNAFKMADELKTLLQTQKAGDKLPFLPLITDVQVMHAQVQYLDFKSGKGVRYLTQYNNGMSPVNNHDMFYTFQGLTSDGKFYVAAVLPVTNPDLPADAISSGSTLAGKAYLDAVAKTVELLNQKPTTSFTPDLAKLDALIRSIEVK